MKNILIILILIFGIISCNKEKDDSQWEKVIGFNEVKETSGINQLPKGIAYLPLYSHIYHIHETNPYMLTVTVSIRNVSLLDTAYILKCDYHNTEGKKIREYVHKPVFLKPLETIEIVISEADKDGGSGANFIFEWAMKNKKYPPLFEAVMISTQSQQGLSFVTRGIDISN